MPRRKKQVFYLFIYLFIYIFIFFLLGRGNKPVYLHSYDTWWKQNLGYVGELTVQNLKYPEVKETQHMCIISVRNVSYIYISTAYIKEQLFFLIMNENT